MLKEFLPMLRTRSLETRKPTSLADLMEEFWRSPFEMAPYRELSYPALDMAEDENEVTLRAELPGIDPKEVDISLEGGVLTIKGEKKFEDEEKRDQYHRIERSYGSFSRSVRLPVEVREEEVKANFSNGVLTVTLPKSEKAKSRKIAIES